MLSLVQEEYYCWTEFGGIEENNRKDRILPCKKRPYLRENKQGWDTTEELWNAWEHCMGFSDLLQSPKNANSNKK